jgi:hypothetical protein
MKIMHKTCKLCYACNTTMCHTMCGTYSRASGILHKTWVQREALRVISLVFLLLSTSGWKSNSQMFDETRSNVRTSPSYAKHQ